MIHLVVDVGNTESVVGAFEPGALEPFAVWRYSTVVPRTADELQLLYRSFLLDRGRSPEEIGRTTVGSVVPGSLDILTRCLERLGEGDVYVLDGDDHLPVRLDVEEPRTVGADRIANTLAVFELHREDTIVVDLGTATTYDCIGADGVFLGGVIAPGLASGQEWLAGRTAKLPHVESTAPDHVIGRRTETCLRSGLFYSAVDAVEGMVRRIREEWQNPGARVIATGGYAQAIAPHLKALDAVAPYLTLVGLELAGGYLAGERTAD